MARRPSALQDAGWHAIAPDLAGFGDSGPDPPGTWERHVEAIERFRRGLGIERCVLVVHDWGGLIGLRWACEHPDAVRRWSSARPGSFPTAGGTAWPRRCARPGTGEEVVAAIDRTAFGSLLRSVSPSLSDDSLDEYWKTFADEDRRRASSSSTAPETSSSSRTTGLPT